MFALLEVLGIYSGLSLVAVYGIWRGIRDLSAWTTQTLYQQGTSGSQLRWSGRNRLPRRVLERPGNIGFALDAHAPDIPLAPYRGRALRPTPRAAAARLSGGTALR